MGREIFKIKILVDCTYKQLLLKIGIKNYKMKIIKLMMKILKI